MVTIKFGEGVDDVGTKAGIHILRVELGNAISILSPVRVVTDPS